MKKIQRESGMKVMLQRTEIDHLPEIDARTYKDLIKESFQHVHQFHKDYERYNINLDSSDELKKEINI